MKKRIRWFALCAAVAAAQVQSPDQIRRATFSHSRGTSGKCTVEVRVDISAEVDIYGDSGRLRTVAGQPATWTRLECTDPLPSRMSDFRFQGIDGRGSVRLIQDPRNSNGMAVIRIDDPKAGAEGYTFDIEWSGASGGAPTGGFPAGGFYPSAGSPARWSNRNLSAERAMDLCRAEVHARGERDYGLRDIDITLIGVDTNPGRRDWIAGAFSDFSGAFPRGGGYRFNCAMDYRSGQVRSVEIARADGSAMRPGSAAGGYDQALRACQDAVVARSNRDGYQNVSFGSLEAGARFGEWISGTITATRGPVTDTFDFRCSMDLSSARVRNLELKRR